MPRTRDCDFCGDAIEPGTGTMFVRTDGTTIHYCSAKCEKNADLGREARDLEWTEDETPEAEADDAEEEEAAEEAEPEADLEDQGQAVDTPGEDTPDLEDVEDDEDVPGPEGEAEDEAAADADAESTAAVDEDDEDDEDEEETEAEA